MKIYILASDYIKKLRCIVIVRQQQASGLNNVPDSSNSGAFELLIIPVPELGEPGLGLKPDGGFLRRESLDPAIRPGLELVLLLTLEVLPIKVLFTCKLSRQATDEKRNYNEETK